MKRIALFLMLAVFGAAPVRGQWINSITLTPAHPTSSDTVVALVDCMFPSGGCDPYVASHSVSGSHIYASALHCLGMLTVICSYTDTFRIAPLPPGNYTFHMQLNAGGGPAPCTPGIVPGPTDSVLFSVAQASGIPSPGLPLSFRISQVPGGLRAEFPGILPAGIATLELFAVDGRRIGRWPAGTGEVLLPVVFSEGIYIALLHTPNGTARQKFVVR